LNRAPSLQAKYSKLRIVARKNIKIAMDKQAFDQEPPFPDGLNVAQLEVINYDKLAHGTDQAEALRLFEACKHYGFFYLKLDGSEKGQKLLEIVKQAFALQKNVFDLPLEEKQPYDQGTFFGYIYGFP
jgi:hypothetical protein